MKRYMGLWLAALVTLLIMAACNTAAPAPQLQVASDSPFSVDWLGHGSDSEKCTVSEGDPRLEVEGDGWIHWVFATKGDSTAAGTYLVVNGVTYYPGEPLNANVWHFYTPYSDLDDLEATIYLDGEPGRPARLVISDFCPGDDDIDLEGRVLVIKDVETSYNRTHLWDIAKRVETENELEHDGHPKVWLYTDGSGGETATWTVDVTYLGFEDSDIIVSGTILIINAGNVPAVVTSVTDVVEIDGAYYPADVTCEDELDGEIYLDLGEDTLCTYEVDLSEALDEVKDGENTATASGDFIFPDDYELDPETETTFSESDTADVEFGDPDTELYATVNIEDIGTPVQFGPVNLGTVTAPNGDTFTYDNEFTYEGFDGECGDFQYDNTATIVETEQAADATLLVNVQCLIFKGETATGEGPQWRLTRRAPNNWFMYTTKENLTDADGARIIAGQHYHIGNVYGYNGGTSMTLDFELFDDWELADVSGAVKVHPMSCATNQNYVQPGQFTYHFDSIEAAEAFSSPKADCYGIHLDVGQWVPDPDFGPTE